MRSYPFRKQDFEVHLQSISWANIFTTYPLHLTCEKQVWESFYVFLEYESLVVIAPAHAGLCHIPCWKPSQCRFSLRGKTKAEEAGLSTESAVRARIPFLPSDFLVLLPLSLIWSCTLWMILTLIPQTAWGSLLLKRAGLRRQPWRLLRRQPKRRSESNPVSTGLRLKPQPVFRRQGSGVFDRTWRARWGSSEGGLVSGSLSFSFHQKFQVPK